MPPIRIVIADDHAILRAGLKTAIDGQPDMEVIAEAEDCQQALNLTKDLAPDVLSLDLSMPGFRSVAMIKQIHLQSPSTRILVLTMHGDPTYARTALAEGCSGYVVKTTCLTAYLEAIRAVSQGETYIDASLISEMEQSDNGKKDADSPDKTQMTPSALSKREQEVLKLLAQGFSYQQISSTLYISTKTIETYRRRLSTKLGLRTRADIVRFALEMGIIGPLNAETSPTSS